jgi:hypothetical protein
MSDQERAPDAVPPGRRRFQFGLRALLVTVFLVATFCAVFVWQLQSAQRQKRCIEAIRERGGHVYYAYQNDTDGVHWGAQSPVPEMFLKVLGEDFFHRVGGVEFRVLLPADWDDDREQSVFDSGCLVPSGKTPNSWERHSFNLHGARQLISLSQAQLNAEDWAKAALRQYQFGCDKVTMHEDYCREALKLDPHNIEANLLLGETFWPRDEDDEPARTHLETVVRYANPQSLEYAHARKLLAGETWSFRELCDRVRPDGVLR